MVNLECYKGFDKYVVELGDLEFKILFQVLVEDTIEGTILIFMFEVCLRFP